MFANVGVLLSLKIHMLASKHRVPDLYFRASIWRRVYVHGVPAQRCSPNFVVEQRYTSIQASFIKKSSPPASHSVPWSCAVQHVKQLSKLEQSPVHAPVWIPIMSGCGTPEKKRKQAAHIKPKQHSSIREKKRAQ